MSDHDAARPSGRRTRWAAFATATLLVAAGCHAAADPPPSAPSRVGAGAEDGELPDGVTVFDDRYPAVTRLDADLLHALREAAADAAADGVEIDVTSGWRSRQHQQRLFEQAVSTYGSAARAAHWVARPGTSAHESGDAVDIGPAGAAAWLSRHGAAYGLCRIYGNEAWHYELRPEAIDDGCPAMYADATQDPRSRQ